MRLQLESAFVLHSRAYKNTSLLFELFTRKHGKLAMIAKGIKQSRSPNKALLQPFNYLYVSATGRGEILTLTDVEQVMPGRTDLSGSSIFSGLYLNELLLRLLPRDDPHESLFDSYLECLESLICQPDHIEPVLRSFELSLLSELGYGLSLENDAKTGEPIESDKLYYYDIEHGPRLAEASDVSPQSLISGRSIKALETQMFDDPVCLREMKILIRRVLNYHLGGKPLKSRELFRK